MRKFILPILLFLMFIPFVVNAETCDTDKISISSITLRDKTENVIELDEATASGKNINLNLSMSNVGDNIEYKIVVKNDSNEDYEIDKTSLKLNSDYINYSFETDDNSNIVKANSSKNVIIRVEYKNEVPDEAFESGTYNDNKSMTLNISTGDTMNVFDTFNNPNTGAQSYILIIVIILLISGCLYILLKKKKYVKYMILVIGIAIIIPISVYAICKCEIKVQSKVNIVNVKYNPCMYDGELVVGAEYVNGQYTYRYKSEIVQTSSGFMWYQIENDGWGVIATDSIIDNYYNPPIPSSEPKTTKLCSTINGKPIVSMANMFYMSNATSIDLSSFDTSNVVNMRNMFGGIKAKELDLSTFDTNKVTNFTGIFSNCSSLKTIYASDKFIVDNYTEPWPLFDNSPLLVGGNGTTYDPEKVGKEYARIDKIGEPGYFTMK